MKPAPVRARRIDDPDRIRVLASPVRHELVDTLSALGGAATVARLAEHLGRHADGLYYHLNLLKKARLVEELMDERSERTFRLAGSGRSPLRLAYRVERGGNASALKTYSGGLLKVAQRDFLRALDQPGVVVSGKRRELWAARNKGWVSPLDLEEANRLLERLCALTSHKREAGRDQLVSLAFVLAPLEQRAKRRD
ncbi:MAG TPA: helix-turn-helix domain-containing protein [Steroidobacteraceae bacterium]|nr:helix-turn-helix domain-containing protein [Steroidobacteraceae bacterium]